MNAEGQTYAQEAGPITQAITQWGADNAISEMTAPEQAWLSALGSHITSNLSYYGQVPAAAVSGLPASVTTALKESGGYPGSTGAGLIGLQSIGTTPQGGSTVKKAQSLTGTPSIGTVPGSTPGP